MGLDTVEILMEVEKTFDIRIPDQEAQQIITVGDFHNAVWRHLSGKHSDKCQSQRLFYKLRRSFADTFDFSPEQLNTHTSPEQIFPEDNRRQVYLKFAESTNLKLPDLVLTKPWSILLDSFGFATIIGGLAVSLILVNFFDYSKWVFLIPVAGILLLVLLSELLNPFRVKIEAPTMRVFTEHALALNYSAIAANDGTNRREMEMVINQIIVNKAGVDLIEVVPEAKIGDDLGID